MEIDLKTIAVGLLSALALSAQAQTLAQPASASPFRLIGALGITFGGDNLGKVQFTNGDTKTIHAGGTVDLRGGLEYRFPASPVALELSVGYHFDTVEAKNGDATFSRWPLDLVLHYSLAPNWRVGVGLRHAMNAKLDVDFSSSSNEKFSSNTAPLVEAEYFVTPELAFKARYATQTYTSKTYLGEKVKGDRFGIYGLVYF